ncbi:MAG: hypothetical protein D6775_08045, partial [Caldilineae bacterium]
MPAAGEPVTFTARVVNQGVLTTSAAAYTWTIDGAAVLTGVLPSLAPAQERDLTLGWLWQSGVHTVSLGLAPAGEEVSLDNNRLAHRTDAYYLEILVHPLFVEAFAGQQNLVGTYSFADWLQAQVAQLNERLAQATYPTLPGGLPDRVRVDVISVTTAVGGDIVSSSLDFDGRWTFRPERDYRATPQDEARESAQNYAARMAGTIDWGLIHELAHQLGVIDLYQLNVSPGAGNHVLDIEGLPLLSGFYWTRPGLMGGDFSPQGPIYFSEHTALALAQNSGYRRGYFGEYLFDLPQQVWLQVLDKRGAPLSGVDVRIYQTRWNVVREKPVASGTSDDRGYFLLPNRPVTPTLTTATGHTLRPNPFGHIDVVGRNGQLLVQLRHAGQETYRWLPITELNKVAWRGEEAVTLTLHTHLVAPDPLLPPAPAGLTAHTQGDRVRLSWQSSPSAAAYNVYRGIWPAYYPFSLASAGITTTTVTLPLTTTSRFAVTAVAGNGAESGFSRVVRAELVHAPAALVWDLTDPLSAAGSVLLIDAHTGRMLKLLPPECRAQGCAPRWLGRVGSEHIGMVGATAAAAGVGGVYGVVLPGQQRVWILDAAQEPVNWFGRILPQGLTPIE